MLYHEYANLEIVVVVAGVLLALFGVSTLAMAVLVAVAAADAVVAAGVVSAEIAFVVM